MLLTVLRDKKGVTLVEVMVALVILLVVFLGLIQASLLSIDSNAMNLLRDEAVRLASDTMISLRSSPFDDLNRRGANPDAYVAGIFTFDIASAPAGVAPSTEAQLNAQSLGINTRKAIRNILNANYLVTVTINNMGGDADNRQADVLVQWDYKGRTLANGNANAHRAVSLLRRT